MLKIDTKELKLRAPTLSAGQEIYLSGKVYTARDAAHKRFEALIKNNQPLPIDIDSSVIYYAGPTPAPKGMVIGSCGPTTSSRMDPYAPSLLDLGLVAMIGKGDRSQEVYDAIVRNKALYLCAVGGAGALAARCIRSAKVVAFDDLGPESIKLLELHDLPLYVGIDSHGNSIFKKETDLL